MEVTGRNLQHVPEPNYDRKTELKAFDETCAGVKGLVDSGITKIPRIFVGPLDDFFKKSSNDTQHKFPIIDLQANRKDVIERVRNASENWGFFQVINHGIPNSDLEEILQGVRRFYEQDIDSKKQWYTREMSKRMVYNCNFDLYSAPVTNWRDTFSCVMAPNPPTPQELPPVCSDILIKYSKQVMDLGHSLFELLSEGLGLDSNYLKDIDCAKGTDHSWPLLSCMSSTRINSRSKQTF